MSRRMTRASGDVRTELRTGMSIGSADLKQDLLISICAFEGACSCQLSPDSSSNAALGFAVYKTVICSSYDFTEMSSAFRVSSMPGNSTLDSNRKSNLKASRAWLK